MSKIESKESKILKVDCLVCLQEVDTYTDEGVLKIENHNYRDSDLQCPGSGEVFENSWNEGGNGIINISIKIDADKGQFDVERLKQRLQEFMELNLSGYYNFSICVKDVDRKQKLLEDAIAAVNLFDQANTGKAIELLGSRGKIAKDAIDDLRDIINKNGKLTILTREQASGR